MYTKPALPAYVPRSMSRPQGSFFLFGPRGTGKSTWLRRVLPDALFLSLEKLCGIHLKKRIGVYTGGRSYVFDGVEILPAEEFFAALHDGRIF